ncbi:Uncharacterised protein [Mycobacterium tuberculosis]|nr:Uncharacterised protein [Mycobacterium tuberculosis]
MEFVVSSSSAGLSAAFSEFLNDSPRSAAVRFLPGTNMSPRCSNLIRNGRSV